MDSRNTIGASDRPFESALVIIGDAGAIGGIERAATSLADRLDSVLGEGRAHLLSLRSKVRLLGALRRVPIVRRLRPITLLLEAAVLALAAIRQRRRAPGPALLVCGHLGLSPVCWIISLLTGARFVVWAHGREVWRPTGRLLASAVRRADQVWAVSHYTASQVPYWLGVPEDKVRVLHHSWHPSFDALVGTTPPTSQRSEAVLVVARLTDVCSYKGVDTVLTAWPTVLERVPSGTLTIVGDGDDKGRLVAMAQRLGIADSVTFAGAVSDAELADLYSSARVLALPSRLKTGPASEGEGFGLVYLEAALARTPSIAANEGGALDFVRDRSTGLLADPRSTESVANALIELLEDADLSDELGWNAERLAREEFSPDAIADATRDLLVGLASGAREKAAARSPRDLRVLLDFSLVAPGGSSTYARGFLDALVKKAPRPDLAVLMPDDTQSLHDQEAALRTWGARVMRRPAGSGSWRARAARQVSAAAATWQLRPDVTFVPQEVAPLLSRGPLVVLTRNVKVWDSSHATGVRRRTKWLLLNVAARVSVARASDVVAVSGVMADQLPVNRSGVRIVWHGCDLAELGPRLSVADWSGEKLRILSIGTLSEHKRFDIVIRTAAILRDHGLQIDLSIWGPAADHLQAQALRSLSVALLGEDVLRGTLEADRKLSELASADVVMLGSSYESFGMSMVEAMRTGNLVLAPRSPIVDEICGGAAVLYEENSASSAASELISALGEAQRLVTRGLLRARRFTWERCVANTFAILDARAVISGSATGAPGLSDETPDIHGAAPPDACDD